MSIKVQITGGRDGTSVDVSGHHQLITSDVKYSNSYLGDLGTANVAVNLIWPKANHIFVVTACILTGNKSIDPNTDATVIVYEATTDITATVTETILQVQLPRSEHIILTGLNLITRMPSSYINAKTDDDDVNVVLMGYYLEAAVHRLNGGE